MSGDRGGVADKTEIIARETLHKGFGTFEKIVFRRRRRDGAMAELKREILDTGDGAAILPYDRARGEINDSKTLVLLFWAKATGLMD